MRVDKTACAVFLCRNENVFIFRFTVLANIVVYDDITVNVICRTRYVVLFLMCNHI